jgi:predicted porin
LSAFAGAASAQSSVTIYGQIEMAVAKSNGGTAGNNGGQAGNSATNSANNVATSNLNTRSAWSLQQPGQSRLGFRGTEDLGNGLSAQFQIEHRFNPDTGASTSSAAFWAGRSYVQLTSDSVGRVYLGREYTPAFWVSLKSDPFAYDSVAMLGSDMFAGFGTPSPLTVPPAGTAGLAKNQRGANSVGYWSPTFGGVSINLATALGEGVVGRDDGFSVQYAAGPIYAGFGYEHVHGGGALAAVDPNSDNGDSLVNFAFHYDLGMVKPMFYYARAKVAATAVTKKYWSLGALAPLGNGRLKAAYERTTPSTPNTNSSKLGLGYDYLLSKRTNLFADVGFTRANAPSNPPTNNTTYALGIKHTF